jgi:uncharacterized protein YdeI (YjbR/CyaY-like superfamily)
MAKPLRPSTKSLKRAPKPVSATSEASAVTAAAVSFATPQAFSAWLTKHHDQSSGIWVEFAKKGSTTPSISYEQALELALCWGWIDGPKRPAGALAWLQRFTPRKQQSRWSKRNRDKALALIESGKMKASGKAEVERARKDGRWDAAYDSPRNATVPADLAQELSKKPHAARFFEQLDSANRYAVLYRVQTAKLPETRARRIAQFVEMLARGETFHPPRRKANPRVTR